MANANATAIGLVAVVLVVVVIFAVVFLFLQRRPPTPPSPPDPDPPVDPDPPPVDPTPPPENPDEDTRDDPDTNLPDTLFAKIPYIAGYFTNWPVYRAGRPFDHNNIPPGYSHLAYAFFGLLDAYKIAYSDSWADNKKGVLPGFIQKCSELGTKPIICIGGWTYCGDRIGENLSPTFETPSESWVKNTKPFKQIWDELLASPTHRKTFIDSILFVYRKHGFKGVDIDLEYPTCPQNVCEDKYLHQKTDFGLFMSELRAAMPSDGLLTMCLSPNVNVLARAYDFKVLGQVCDKLHIMTYDYYVYLANAKTGHNQPKVKGYGETAFFDIDETLSYITRQEGIDSKKLAVGFAAYARGYRVSDASVTEGLRQKRLDQIQSTGPPETRKWTQQAGVAALFEICDETSSFSSYYSPGDGTWALKKVSNGYELFAVTDIRDIRSIRMLMAKYKIDSCIVYAIDQDDYENKCGEGSFPLLQNILKSGKLPTKNILKALPPTYKRDVEQQQQEQQQQQQEEEEDEEQAQEQVQEQEQEDEDELVVVDGKAQEREREQGEQEREQHQKPSPSVTAMSVEVGGAGTGADTSNKLRADVGSTHAGKRTLKASSSASGSGSMRKRPRGH